MKILRLILMTSVILGGCEVVPPLRVTAKGTEVVIGVETLGEYPTTISRIRISEKNSGAAILELYAEGERLPQIWNITLKQGGNTTDSIDLPEVGLYRVLTPADGQRFTIERGTTYLVEVWGKSGKTPATAEFRL